MMSPARERSKSGSRHGSRCGYARRLDAEYALEPGVGGFVSAVFVPEALQPRYGGVGVGIGLFLTLRPAAHQVAP